MAARSLLLTVVLAAAACSGTWARELLQPKPQGDIWALLIAGSAGWGNYRHQADVAHAYQILRHGGVREDRIVTMMFDDIADNPQNPHPGQVFNRPHGPDVYAGVKIDYTRDDVNAENFLAVLAGNASALSAGKRSTQRVIESTPQDKIFVYYSDHGAPGIVGMPSGPFLYADQLHAVIATRARNREFAEMVLYIEACESGSMFEGLLEDNLSVYATTAANGHESSWGTYCPGMAPSPPPEFGTCLGDLYSVAWLENAEHADLTIETLKKQFQLVKMRTSNNFTYSMGSHVMRFGAMEIAEEVASEFMGPLNTGDGTASTAASTASRTAAAASTAAAAAADSAAAAGGRPVWEPMGAVAQRDADLVPLWHAWRTAEGAEAKAEALARLNAEVARRAEVDASVADTVRHLLSSGPAPLAALLSSKFGGAPQLGLLLAVGAGPEALPASQAALVERLVGSALPRPAGAALVDDWDCLRAMVAEWEGAHGALDQYSMRHSRAFANLCNAGLPPAELGAAAAAVRAARDGLSMTAEVAGLVGPDAHIAAA